MKFEQMIIKQRGYTMIETVVAIAVFGIIAGICGLALQQIVTVPEKGDSQVDALHEIQNAIHWVSLDAGAAEAAVGGTSLTLTMPDDTTAAYSRTANTLYRNYNGGTAQTIAQNITDLKFTVSGRTVMMEITSAPDGRWDISESETCRVAMRPMEDVTHAEKEK